MSNPADNTTGDGRAGANARVVEAFCEAVNHLKRTALSPASLSGDAFLGGDLGIDSMEMLEIWFELEQRLQVRVSDAEKRDVYTVAQVAAVVAAKL